MATNRTPLPPAGIRRTLATTVHAVALGFTLAFTVAWVRDAPNGIPVLFGDIANAAALAWLWIFTRAAATRHGYYTPAQKAERYQPTPDSKITTGDTRIAFGRRGVRWQADVIADGHTVDTLTGATSGEAAARATDAAGALARTLAATTPAMAGTAS